MIKDFKQVKNDLQEYYKKTNNHFFNKSRIKKLTKLSLVKTRYLWIYLIVLVLLFYLNPKDRTLSNKFSYLYSVYGPQILIFILFFILILIMMIFVFVIITDEYNNYLTHTYKHFVKVMKLYTTLAILIIMALIANGQFYYIHHFLIPPLESCTYIDKYGNTLYSSNQVGACPELFNIEEDYDLKLEESIVRFDVLTSTELRSYEYGYQNNKMVNRIEKIYILEETEDIELIKIHTPNQETRQRNTYFENEFSSLTTKIINQTKTTTEIVSKLNDQNEIVVTYDANSYDHLPPVEQFRLLKKDDGIKLEDYFSITFSDLNNFVVNYDSLYFNQEIINLKRAEYTIFNLDKERVPIVSKLSSNREVKFNFTTTISTSRVIDQEVNGKLLYRHTFQKNELGFLIRHFSYRRDKLGRFLPTSKYNDYCFNYNKLSFEYDYLEFLNSDQLSTCGEDLIYRINPIFLIE